MELFSTFNEQFHQSYNLAQLWLWVVGRSSTKLPCSRKESQKLWNCKSFCKITKICRKPKQQIKPKPRINNVDDTISEAATGVPQRLLESKSIILIDCFKNTVSTMQTTILTMMTLMTILLQQSPLMTILER